MLDVAGHYYIIKIHSFIKNNKESKNNNRCAGCCDGCSFELIIEAQGQIIGYVKQM